MQTGLELLETGELRVRRTDADELIAVRDGALSYDDLLVRVTELELRTQAAARTTSLPGQIDLGFVDSLVSELIRRPDA